MDEEPKIINLSDEENDDTRYRKKQKNCNKITYFYYY